MYTQLLANWKIILIMFLFAVIGFGGWWYQSENADLQAEVNTLGAKLIVSESNGLMLRDQISSLNEGVEELERSNATLEDNVLIAKNKIADLENNPETKIVYETIYRDALPLECADKFGWLRSQAIEIGSELR